MVYIWFRFEWQFAIGAVATLIHDAVLTIGFFALTQIDFNLSSIAAILTIIGYSLNDTVVIFDRIRELLRRYKQMPLGDLIDLATNQTLARTIMTSLTTLLALVRALLLRRRGHPLLHRRDALGRVRRDRLLDLHRRPDPDLLQPPPASRSGRSSAEASRSRPSPPRPDMSESGGGFLMQPARFPGRAPIDAYGNGGFRFADMSHRGSILALPSGIEAWPVASVADITPEALARLIAEAAAIEILLVGTGDAMVPLPKESRAALEAAGLFPELMATGAAVRTYNVLLSEERAVAAALVAVESVR